jgi:hypothetical protein
MTKPIHGVELVQEFTSQTHNCDLPYQLPISIEYANTLEPLSSPIWQMTDVGDRYISQIELFKEQNTYSLNVNCEGKGTFTFKPSSLAVKWQADGTGYEHYLQSLGIALWLELKGVPCIHANAIELDNFASLIIAPSRTGKSTLTTHLLHQGFKMMTDDMAAIHTAARGQFMIYPSWPKIRLWPDVVDDLVGTEVDNDTYSNANEPKETETKSVNGIYNNTLNKNAPKLSKHKKTKVHQKFAKHEIEFEEETDVWENTPKQLKAIYYLERHERATQKCEIARINASHGLMTLLQNSILADAYKSMEVETQRLQKLAKILETIPIFKISYPSGLEHLDYVGIELKKHLKSLK